MLEIDKAVVDLIAGDATISGYTGASAADDRIYAWYPIRDIEYTEGTVEMAIIYRNSMGTRTFRWSYPSQIPNIIYFFRVLSINPLKLRQCTERLVDLFDETSLQTTNWNVKRITISGVADGMQEGSPSKPIMSKSVTFSFSNVLRR
jgi:hypothetical protein